MPKQSFTEALATRPWLLADGATGTNYFQMGLVSGDAPELELPAPRAGVIRTAALLRLVPISFSPTPSAAIAIAQLQW